MGFKFKPKRFGLRRWRNDRQALLEFNRSISLIADPAALMASITARIKEIFGADRVLFLRSDEGIFSVAFSSGWNLDELRSVRLAPIDRLAKWLQTNETPLGVKKNSSVFNYLTSAEQETLLQLDVRVCVPLLALNRLTGLMLLSSTDEKWDLGEDDLMLLQMLMSQASIAFENAYLYQQQRDRLQRLYRAEKLAAAGELAASVAHEIRNPLTSIRSTIQYLLGDFAEHHPKRELMEGLIAEVDRIDRTVDGLLSLTRSANFVPERVAVGELIDQTILLLRTQGLKQSVEIVWKAPSPDIHILGDPSQLKQLFLNLILNALQAMSGGGQLIAEAGAKQDANSDKTWAIISFLDDGCGISANQMEKIFDPFFTTKKEGTGLGLSTSYAITREHGGEIEIQSRVDEGTKVALKFPLIQ